MAQRRMFSPQIVGSEEFLTMPISSQALYFHLGMNADDDGFVQPKVIMRSLGSGDDDLKVLLAKRFLLPFDSGVVVIKHWLIHNLIQKDRYHPTRFQDEKKALYIKENKAYTDSVNKMLPQVRLGKVSIELAAIAANPSKVEETPSDDVLTKLLPLQEIEDTPSKGKNYTKAYETILHNLESLRDREIQDNFKFLGDRRHYYKVLKSFRLANGNTQNLGLKWLDMCKDTYWSQRGFTLEDCIKELERKPIIK